MARMDQMLHLIELGLERNHSAFDNYVRGILEDEKKVNHSTAVKKIEAMLNDAVQRFNSNPNCYFNTAVNENMVQGFCYTKLPKLTLDDIVLTEENRNEVLNMIVEQEKTKELEAEGLEPRHKMILSGPPGNGKTCLAEVIAGEMGLPLLTVKYENLIRSELGRTGRNFYEVMSYACKQRCVLFLDEFDAIAKSRMNASLDVSEMNRLVNSVLMELEQLPPYVIFIAATNLTKQLDPAVWRRFQWHLTLDAPKEEDLWKFYFYYADRENNNFHPDLDMEWLAKSTVGFSFAMAKELMVTLHRNQVLHGKGSITKSFVSKLIKQYKAGQVV